ncbi:MAG: hypothetical protein RQ752_16740 [Thermohalobaculum sp.]|nr:hypothetical protein [Thermohalobaculum sp.]
MTGTRLDKLWQAVMADPEAERPWLDFYEGLATARLHLALDAAAGARVRPTLLALADGPAALAFDGEDRFAAAIGRPTEHAVLTGAELAGLLAGQGVALALNPGAGGGCETVLAPDTLAWVAQHFGAPAAADETRAARIGPPAAPEPALLDALARRLADFGGAVAEAWLVDLSPGQGAAELALVIRPGPAGEALAGEIAAALTRAGQIATARPFAVAPAAEGARLLAAARCHGIGIAG